MSGLGINTSQSQFNRSPESKMNLQQSPMNMLTGASPSRGTKEDLGMDGGAFGLTELKSINPKDFAS